MKETNELFMLKSAGMKYTKWTKLAMKICFDAHKNQVDKGGIPYVFHPFHLAEQMDTEEEICVALLHDVVEDTDYTIEDLKKYGFSKNILEAIALLTHDDEVPYMEYVRKIKKNSIARKVKLADLKHNSDSNRMDLSDESAREKAEKRLIKYEIAKGILQEDTEYEEDTWTDKYVFAHK